jgi:hypothetical protein
LRAPCPSAHCRPHCKPPSLPARAALREHQPKFQSRSGSQRMWSRLFGLRGPGGNPASMRFSARISSRGLSCPPGFPKTPFSWIIDKDERGLTAPLSVPQFRIPAAGANQPCVAACQSGVPTKDKLLASRGGWPIPKYRRTTQCAKLSPCSVRRARTETTPPRRIRRRLPAGSSFPSSAIRAANTRRIKRPSRAASSQHSGE